MSKESQTPGQPALPGRARNFISSVRAAALIEGGFIALLKTVFNVFRTEGFSGLAHRTGGTLQRNRRNNYQEWIRRYDTLTDSARERICARIDGMDHQPLISVLMPTYNVPVAWLEEAIDSVRSQLYGNWELCIADDASTDPGLRRFLEEVRGEDGRIKLAFRKENGHISAASNTALDICAGEWVALMDHDDVLPEHALYHVAEAVNQNPQARLIYSDEDKISESGHRFDPYFKCSWNPDLFLSQNFISHLGVYRRDMLEEIGGFREGYEGSQDYDLALRFIERIDPENIVHIPRVLYHWRMHPSSTSSGVSTKPYAQDAGRRAIQAHLDRCGIPARAESHWAGYDVKYEIPPPLPRVSLLIAANGEPGSLERTVDSVGQMTDYEGSEILVIDDGSNDSGFSAHLSVPGRQDCVEVIRSDSQTSHGTRVNSAVKRAKGEYIAFLSPGIEIITPGWLNEMLAIAVQAGVGAVGAKLLGPDKKIMHAGLILGPERVAGRAFSQFSGETAGYFGRPMLVGSFSALSADCLLVNKSIYEQVGGLDETTLIAGFEDIDFCLKILEAGYRNVWTPNAILLQRGPGRRNRKNPGKTQERLATGRSRMKERWGDRLANDPAYSPNLTLEHEDFSYAWPPRVQMP